MKKVLAAVLVLCVVLAAGAAFAQQGNSKRRGQQQPMMGQQEFKAQAQGQPEKFPPMPPRFEGQGKAPRPCPEFGGRCGRGQRTFAPDMPPEIREKAAELAKLRVDLEEALTSKPVNKAKALDVHAKMQKLENEIDTWRFEQKLEHMEDFRKQMELNKKIPPAKPMPKEEAKDAPEK